MKKNSSISNGIEISQSPENRNSAQLEPQNCNDNQTPKVVKFKKETILCLFLQDTVEDAVITPEGNIFSKNHILAWVKNKKTNPATNKSLHLSQLRRDKLLNQIISNIEWSKSDEEEIGSLDISFLKDPRTNKFFNNPCVHQNGTTFEAKKGTFYQSRALVSLIEAYNQQTLAPEKLDYNGPEDIVDEKTVKPEFDDNPLELESAAPIAEGNIFPLSASQRTPLMQSSTSIRRYNDNNEESSSQPSDSCGCGHCLACIGCIATLTSVITAAVYLSRADSDTPINNTPNPVTFLYSAPYVGGGELQIFNDGADEIAITSYSFTTNTEVTKTVNANNEEIYDFWGTLYKWNADINAAESSDGQSITYTIKLPENEPIIIGPNSSAKLQYNYQSALGPLNTIGMNPSQVSVHLEGHSSAKLLQPYGHCVDEECNDPTPDYLMSGYYNNQNPYGSNQYPATQIPTNRIDRVLYASIGFSNDGSVTSTSTQDSIQLPTISQMRQQYSYLSASLSFGGRNTSSTFRELTSNPTAMENFINNAISVMQETGFNGIDINWQFPANAEEGQNYANLLTQLRTALDIAGQQNNQRYYLTIFAPGDSNNINAITPESWSQIKEAVDQINLGTFNYFGPQDSYSDHQSQMNMGANDPYANDPTKNQSYVVATVNHYLQLGFNSTQLVMGVPTSWTTEYVNNPTNNGLYQSIIPSNNGALPGQYYQNNGKYSNACLFDKQCDGGAQFPGQMQYFNDTECEVSYGFSSDISAFGTGDDGASANNKANYVVENKLGGTNFEDLAGDVHNTSASNSLIGNTFDVYANVNNTSTNTTQSTKISFNRTPITAEQTTSGFGMIPALFAVGGVLAMSAYSFVKSWQSGYYKGEDFTREFEALNKKAQILLSKVNKLSDGNDKQDLYIELRGITGFDLDLGEAQAISKHTCEKVHKKLDSLALKVDEAEGRRLRASFHTEQRRVNQPIDDGAGIFGNNYRFFNSSTEQEPSTASQSPSLV